MIINAKKYSPFGAYENVHIPGQPYEFLVDYSAPSFGASSWSDVKQWFADEVLANWTGQDLTLHQISDDPTTNALKSYVYSLLDVSTSPSDLVTNVDTAINDGSVPPDQALALIQAKTELQKAINDGTLGGQLANAGKGLLSGIEGVLLLAAAGGVLYIAWPAITSYIGARSGSRR